MGGRKVLTAGIVIAAAGAILGGMAGGAWLPLHYVGKPLATLLILGVAATAVDADRRYRRWIVLGLVFSLMGDVWLMLPGDYFVAGLIAFLLAHLAYISAFLPGLHRRAALPAALCLAAYAVGYVWLLWPYLPAALRLPVLVYVGVLALMAIAALGRRLQQPVRGASRDSSGRAALGGVLFIASDSVLAWDRFTGGVPLALLLVLSTYYLAQWCIACSVSASANRPR
ncbi:hypothetical protein ARC78_13325 [Stenotrophomonas pictorum JCM 9942]|uniref:Lysoplasmalogenase n=1 Tax=Stenotrophomonas pictorum JCM 9942 TaxID=1236960 RepID=A0A0R0ADC3_9GAMM|nr:lysoplasmalogenase [Stenotrophomonas pictorum]KRG39934.1 hypothetical protein ARC78_13325 [Stenotrophomonas pictorum JCM 9942]